MACELATVQEDACTSGIGKVQDPIMLLQIIAQLTADIVADTTGLAITPTAIQSRGCTSGILKIQDEIMLLQIIAQLNCDQA